MLIGNTRYLCIYIWEHPNFPKHEKINVICQSCKKGAFGITLLRENGILRKGPVRSPPWKMLQLIQMG